jgi:hypothetical protein
MVSKYSFLVEDIKEGAYRSALSKALNYAREVTSPTPNYTPEQLEEKMSEYFQWMVEQGAMDSIEKHLEAIVDVLEDMLTVAWEYSYQLLPIFFV